MTIYADSSLLVSRLYPGDTSHAGALACFRKHPAADWLSTPWSEFETINSLRQLGLRTPGPKPEVAEALRRLFKLWHERGPFERVDVDFNEAMREFAQISAASGSSLRMRAADVLHVAFCEQINPDLFITRDKDQYDLAVSRAIRSEFVP